AEGRLQRGIDETELLFQAETAMLAATASLSACNYDTATVQMREALKYLIEGRNRLEIGILKRRDRALLALLRQFDRMQQQKLRRPKSDEEQARQIAQQLEQLVQQEDELSAALMPSPSASPFSAPGSSPPAGATQADNPTKEKLEDRQLDIAAEARESEKALNKLGKAADCEKARRGSE